MPSLKQRSGSDKMPSLKQRSGSDKMLTRRQLNRATLARQMLLERTDVGVAAAVERLVGLQAQQAQAPFVGLWTRLSAFDRDCLAEPIARRVIVKATMMRATLHVLTARDYLALRATLAPVLAGGATAIARSRGADIDVDAVLEAAREFLAAAPRSFAEISTMLTERFPDADVGAMRYSVRMHLSLVQVPADTQWSYPGNARFALAEAELGEAIASKPRLPELVRRYLAAFGPATPADMQTWCGLRGLRATFDDIRDELTAFTDEAGRTLFDVDGADTPDEAAAAPVRFLPQFDNLLLSHTDRTRIIADDHRARVYLPGLRVAATFLVDGFVAGVWTVQKAKGQATLQLEPFAKLGKADRDELANEAERLVRFVEPGTSRSGVAFTR